MVSRPRRRAARDDGSQSALGWLLVERRLQLGITQLEVADLSGVGLSTVRALEAGAETVGLRNTVDVLHALGLSLGVGSRAAVDRARDVLLVERSRARDDELSSGNDLRL